MTEARGLIGFIAAVVGAFVYICNAIPQIRSEPIVAETRIGESPQELVGSGRRIFTSDRAQCLTCHSFGEDPKARCPNQEGLGERAPRRKAGMDAAEYLVESVYDPNAFIVPGYPRNQMTPIDKPPIALSHDEILAALAFLNTLGGTTDADFVARLRKAQEPWRRGLRKPQEGLERAKLPILPGDPDRGGGLFKDWGCDSCHRVGTEGAGTYPDLTVIGGSQTAEYILESIVDPNAVIVRGYKEVRIVWKEMGRVELRGRPVAWIPDKDHPQALRLRVRESGTEVEREIDLSHVAYVGDTTVGVKVRDGLEVLAGEYVQGSKETGLTLELLEGGRWAKRAIAPEDIEFLNLPGSAMPWNYAEMMTPREVYDLVAYLGAQKGKK